MPTLTLTPELGHAIADAVANGVPLETATVAAGVGRAVAYGWLQLAELGRWPNGLSASPEAIESASAFAELIKRARAEWEAKQVKAIAEAAQSINEKTGIREWRAAAWLLNNHPATRQTYREHRESHQTIDVQRHPAHQQVKQLSDDELLALEAGLEPEKE